MKKRKSRGVLRFFRNVFIGFAAVIAALGITGIVLWRMAVADIEGRGRGEGGAVVVEIPKGSSAAAIAGRLEKEGVIRSALLFRLYARSGGGSPSFQYGAFTLERDLSYDELIERLQKTVDKEGARFTVPEGYTFAQIAGLLEQKGIADVNELTKAYNNADFDFEFIKDIPKRENRLEGYLFPDTYEIFKGESAKSILGRMLANFEKKTRDYKAKAQKAGLTLDEAVTLASAIQTEGKKTSEFTLISSVLHNRLDIGMKLQCDATVQYALPQRKESLTFEDLKIVSPYNTYLYAGLPVGPISNPGTAALEAAVNPEQSDYLFYRVDKRKTDGSHVFSRTYDEHQAAG